MSERYLTEVERRVEQGKLRCTWSDDHVAEFDYDYLRGYCPCAGCQGHAAGPVRFQSPETSVTPVVIQPVGNYGISIQWSDGHATGIYRFEFLREICPCAECRQSADSSPPEG